MKVKIGYGIFSWASIERQSDRYGSFYLGQEAIGGAISEASLDSEALRTFTGARVKVTAKVLEARRSGHVGDLSHSIFPTTPEVGEVVEIGVGCIGTESNSWDGTVNIFLKPEDGREEFWLDPHKLYRLHDQTVEIYVECTSDPCHPPPILNRADESAINNGDGSYQVKTTRKEVKVLPNVERLGDGLFALHPIGSGEMGTKHQLG
jgi:hypothetical protein